MTVPVLRHDKLAAASIVAANTAYTVVSAVSANRAFVISKLIITPATAGAVTFVLTAGGVPIANGTSISPGQVYTETGLVLLANETLTISSNTIGGVAISVFGEEADN